MKRNLCCKLFLIFALFACAGIYGCKKTVKPRCEPITGIYYPNHYLFWINYDPKTAITVQVKDANGKAVSTIYPTTSVYFGAGQQPSSCTVANCARFDLDYGADYTYTASNANGLSWSGTIQTPCDVNQCLYIQLK